MTAAEYEAIREHLKTWPQDQLLNLAVEGRRSQYAPVDYIADVFGTRMWCVAARLTPRLKDKGYKCAIPQPTYLRMENLWRAGASPEVCRASLGLKDVLIAVCAS